VNLRRSALSHSKLKNGIEDSKLTIQALADTIADLLNKLGDCGSKKPDDAAKPKPRASSSPTSGVIDSCLVGAWRSQSVAVMDIDRGGAGILLTIKGDGTATIDYNGMKPIDANVGATTLWSGTATGHITTSKRTATVKSVEKSELTAKQTDPQGKNRSNPLSGLGPAGLGNRSYICDETTLTSKGPSLTFTFKREKKEP